MSQTLIIGPAFARPGSAVPGSFSAAPSTKGRP